MFSHSPSQGVLRRRQTERIDIAIHRRGVDPTARDGNWRLVRSTQNKGRQRLASVGTGSRIRHNIALGVDEVERADIDDAVGDRRGEKR